MRVIISVMLLQFLSFVLMTNVEKVWIKFSISKSTNKEKSKIFNRPISFQKDEMAYGYIHYFLSSAELEFNEDNLTKIRVTAANDDFSNFAKGLLSDEILNAMPDSDNDKKDVDPNPLDENTDHPAQLNSSTIVSNQLNDAATAKADDSKVCKTKYFSKSFVDFLLEESESKNRMKEYNINIYDDVKRSFDRGLILSSFAGSCFGFISTIRLIEGLNVVRSRTSRSTSNSSS